MLPLPEEDWFPEACNPESLRVINERCLLRSQDGHHVVLVSGIMLAQYAASDRMAEAYAMVSLMEQGWANQVEIARAFACSVRTVRRHQRRFEAGGLAALGHPDGYPPGRGRLVATRERLVQRLAARLGPGTGVGPGAGSQNAAAQADAVGRRRTRRSVGPSARPAPGRLARDGAGFPLHRRSCAGLSRAARAAQDPCGTSAGPCAVSKPRTESWARKSGTLGSALNNWNSVAPPCLGEFPSKS